jgi:hypothetical protein
MRKEYKNITAGDLMDYGYVFSIPVFGVIASLFFAVRTRNEKLRNLAVTSFVMAIVLIAAYLIAFVASVDF